MISLVWQGAERPSLIGLAGAGFNNALTTTKASDPCLEARQDDYIKGMFSPGRLGLSPGRTQLDMAALLPHSHQKDMPALIFQILQSFKYYLKFFNGQSNTEYMH